MIPKALTRGNQVARSKLNTRSLSSILVFTLSTFLIACTNPAQTLFGIKVVKNGNQYSLSVNGQAYDVKVGANDCR